MPLRVSSLYSCSLSTYVSTPSGIVRGTLCVTDRAMVRVRKVDIVFQKSQTLSSASC